MPRIRFDRAIASAMQQKPGAPPPADRIAAAEQPTLLEAVGMAVPSAVRRRFARPIAMLRRGKSLAKSALRRLLARPARLTRRILFGPLQVQTAAIHAQTAVLQHQTTQISQVLMALHEKVDSLQIVLAGLHTKQDSTSRSLEAHSATLARLETEAKINCGLQAAFDEKLVAMRARIDDISIKVRGPIELDERTWALRTADGYAAVPKSDTTLTTMLIDADVGGLEPGTRSLIRKLLPPGGTFVDVGAHIGLLTLAGARAVGSKGRVYSFEAAPDTYKLLERTVSINHVSPPVVLRSVAVGAEEGEHVFHVRSILGHSSLYDFSENDEGFTVEDVTVQVMPLDRLLPAGERIDLVKIDVEGAELDVLAGMTELLDRNPEVALLTEFGPSHLKRAGQTPEAWFAAFENHGLEAHLVDEESGACKPVSPKEVAEVASVNLLFVAPYSRAARLVA